MAPGSCDRAAELAARALLGVGASNLQVKIGAHVASRGNQCWETDRKVRSYLKRWDGRPYHRESIGRARRAMRARGWIASVRIYAAQKPPGAKHPSTHGTTSKWIDWQKLGLANPLTRGQRREARREQEKVHRATKVQQEKTSSPARRAFFAFIDSDFLKAPTAPGVNRKSAIPPDKLNEDERQAQAEKNAAKAREWLSTWTSNDSPPPGKRGPPD